MRARKLANTRSIAAACLAVLALPAAATAETERIASYPFSIAWATAVRFLRIDEGFAIVERDPDNGYVLFKLAEDKREYPGALEVIPIRDQDDRNAVRLVLRISDRPRYMESGVLDRLLHKLRKEHGDPLPAPRKPPPDEGKNKDKEDDDKSPDKPNKKEEGKDGDKDGADKDGKGKKEKSAAR